VRGWRLEKTIIDKKNATKAVIAELPVDLDRHIWAALGTEGTAVAVFIRIKGYR
jgi:hypothetical protein